MPSQNFHAKRYKKAKSAEFGRTNANMVNLCMIELPILIRYRSFLFSPVEYELKLTLKYSDIVTRHEKMHLMITPSHQYIQLEQVVSLYASICTVIVNFLL